MDWEALLPVPSGVLMAIDWGGRRVGVALSDPTQTIATPLAVLTRQAGFDSLSEPDPAILRELLNCASDHQASAIVFGIPYYHLSGDVNPRANLFMDAGRSIGRCLSLPVFCSDEGHTSSDASEIALGSGRRRKKGLFARKVFTDHLAAAALLQRFLDAALHGGDRRIGCVPVLSEEPWTGKE